MFILKEINQLTKAIEKARKIHPRVEFDHFGRYRVSGSRGGYYTVVCRKDDRAIKAANEVLFVITRRRGVIASRRTGKTARHSLTKEKA